MYAIRQMEHLSEAHLRKNQLEEELRPEIDNEIQMGNSNHLWSLAFMILALLATVITAIIGVFSVVSSKVVGAMALIPSLIAFAAVNLKLDGKSSWHYRKADALDALRSELLYQLPEVPTVADVRAIDVARIDLTKHMQEEWDRTLALNWSGLMNRAHHVSQSNGSSEVQDLARPNRGASTRGRRPSRGG